jgi:hypothetical protein
MGICHLDGLYSMLEAPNVYLLQFRVRISGVVALYGSRSSYIAFFGTGRAWEKCMTI